MTQTLDLLNQIRTALHNAQDEIDDIQDNDALKAQAIKYLIEAELSLYTVIDNLEDRMVTEGYKSGAV